MQLGDCIIASLLIFRGYGALLNLESQLMTLAQPEPRPYFEHCRQKPRFKNNVTGICYLNASMGMLHKMFCYPSFKNFLTSHYSELIEAAPSTFDLVENTRRVIYNILSDYENPFLNDLAFAQRYDAFIKTLTESGIFDACGGFAYDVIINLLNSLFKVGDIRRHWGELPIAVVECISIKSSLPSSLGKTSLEQHLEVVLARKQLYHTELLCIAAPLSYIQTLYKPWKDTGLVFPLEYGFTFPEEFDIIKCYPASNNSKTVLYRLNCVIVKQPSHGFTIVRHGAIWYWVNDIVVAELPQDAIHIAAKTGQFSLAAGSRVQQLSQGAIHYGISQKDDVALPCIFLYERVHNK